LRQDSHESFGRDDIKPPSDRSTGLVFAVVALIIAVWWRNSLWVSWIAIGGAVLLAILALAAPAVLRPLNWIWFRVGLLMHRV
jgi:hypothetical protein